MAGEESAKTVGQRVVLEVGDTEQAFGGLLDVVCHDSQSLVVVQDTGDKEHDGQDQGHQVLQASVVEDAHVLQVVAGLDVANGLFDAPSFDVGTHYSPQALETRPQRLGRQQEQLFVPEPVDHQ